MKASFEKASEEYSNIKASDALRQRVMAHFEEKSEEDQEKQIPFDENRRENEELNKMNPIKSNKSIKQNPSPTGRPLWQKITASAAGLVLALGLGLNLSPAFADAVASVPGLAGLVSVLTLGRYEVDDSGFQVNIETPKIQGLLNKELQDKLNAEFKEYAQALIVGVEGDIAELKAQFPGESTHYGLDSGFEVITDNDQYLVIDVYLVNTVGSSTTIHKFYTIDKATQELVTLESLFGSDKIEAAIKAIEDYILTQMRSQMDAGSAMYWLDDPGMMPSPLVTRAPLFYFNKDKNLVIAFEEYSVAPGSEGTPSFVIPESVISQYRK